MAGAPISSGTPAPRLMVVAVKDGGGHSEKFQLLDRRSLLFELRDAGVDALP